jgi:hypothetical protein
MAPEVKTTKNNKLPKLSENCFELVGKGGWPLIFIWIRNSLDHETNQHFMQALSTRKENKDRVQIKGIFNNKTTGNCA